MSDLNEKIVEYYENYEASKLYRETANRLKAEIIQEMQMKGSSRHSHPDFEVKLTSGTITPNMDYILPLLESPIADELIDSGAYIPAHTETKEVPATVKYDKLNRFKQNGEDYADAIEKSKMRVFGLSVKPKKQSQ